MSRKNLSFNKKILPDYKFNSKIISKFINLLMLKGKKTLARYIVYKSLDIFFNKINNFDILNFEKNVIEKVKPIIEVKSRKIGGSKYSIPVEISINRANTLAIRWIINSARKRLENKFMFIKLSNEYIDILNNKGFSLKKRDEIHKIAESNKAFTHYKL
ncbi:30S ribosomal protein S7 [endosymbiont of Euscepes postfasciatus]|uniref:30S ribosomal protein S7 n=1 Tax=endosymbiont of Euscepes postfasciatus TaxID=650377 RepID=UPI000DC6E4E2|nr:30S ribosomal protein S7 [endosymbiont of Euscepes postfasciatus]BBA84696.1 30S ribosomal protein S7 [endosymbiont of Euscepes postfasciatus]